MSHLNFYGQNVKVSNRKTKSTSGSSSTFMFPRATSTLSSKFIWFTHLLDLFFFRVIAAHSRKFHCPKILANCISISRRRNRVSPGALFSFWNNARNLHFRNFIRLKRGRKYYQSKSEPRAKITFPEKSSKFICNKERVVFPFYFSTVDRHFPQSLYCGQSVVHSTWMNWLRIYSHAIFLSDDPVVLLPKLFNQIPTYTYEKKVFFLSFSFRLGFVGHLLT